MVPRFLKFLAAVIGVFGVLYAYGSAADDAPAKNTPVRILALGDSLTAGYGLPPGQSFVDRLQIALNTEGINAEIIQGGKSGDTSAGGLSRLDWMLATNPDAVIVELGANDALRGLDPEQTRQNLQAILDRLAADELPVLFAGMMAPPNMGPDFAEAFEAVFDDLADTNDVIFYPFFLEGVAANPALNLADGIHPNEAGITVIVENILPDVRALIARVGVTG